jgi:hypothetical protein
MAGIRPEAMLTQKQSATPSSIHAQGTTNEAKRWFAVNFLFVEN